MASPQDEFARVTSQTKARSGGAAPAAPRDEFARVTGETPSSDGGGGSFLGNLVGDPIHAAVGFIPGLYHIGEAGLRDFGDLAYGRTPTHVYHTAVVPLGQDPLVQEVKLAFTHPGQTSPLLNLLHGRAPRSPMNEQIAQGHLLVPALDVLGAVSFGAARAGALGLIGERAPGVTVGQAARTAILRGRHSAEKMGEITVRDAPGGAPIPTRTLPRNVYQAARMRAVDKTLKTVTHEIERITGKPWGSFPLVGESARAARAVEKISQDVKLAHLSDPRFAEYQQAFSKLNTNERVALNTLGRVPLPDDLEGWKTILEDQTGEQARTLLERLNDPKMREIYDDPRANKKVARALDAARGIVEAREDILVRTGALTREAARAAAYGPSRVARGAEFVTEQTYNARLADVDTALRGLGADITATMRTAKNVGKPVIRAETGLAEDLARQAGRSSKIRGKYRAIVGGMDAARSETSRLRSLVETVMGGTIDTDTLTQLGFKVRPGSDLAAMRIKALGILFDRLGPAYDKLEKTLAAAHGLEREIARGEEIAGRQGASAAALRRARENRIGALQSERAALEELVSLRRSMETLRGEIEAGGFNKLVGGGTPGEIEAELAAARRPQPFYTPDVPAGSRQSRAAFSKSGGRTPPTSDVKASQRILFRMGQVALHPDLLTPSFLRAAAFDAKIAKHEKVKEIATPIAEGEHLPADMEWVREVRGERIPFTLSTAGEHLAEMDKVFPEDKKSLTIPRDGVGDIAMDAEGRRLAVSRSLASKLETQVRKEGFAVKWFLQKPIDVWRALVLNLRIPWLVNNIVGNNLLYALRFAGVDGLKAYVGLLSEPVRTKLFRLPATQKHLTREDMAEIFPGQTRGTFIETQTPASLGAGTVRKLVRGAGLGLAPLDRRTEQALRRSAVEAVLRGSPEVKAIYRAMPKQERSLREAMRRAATGNEELKRLANTEANRALGDYLSLSPVEQTYLRRVAPFYGWYREIARIAAHAVVDTPVRVALLARYGILEEQRQQDQRGLFPSYLEGSIAVGGGPPGTQRVLTTRALNPFSTVGDELRIAQFLTGGGGRAGASAALGVLNPYALGATEYAIARAQGNPTDLSYQGGIAGAIGGYGGPFGAMAGSVFGGLPQVRAISPPPPSRLYPTRDRNTLLWQLLGDIRRDVNLQQAHLYGTQRR